ncbi:MAG: signal protein [Micromonosporaceae bacterium]|jgi:NO-binding membrane sensor protein with MHYT domain|nr:signal protein [Micromonosporaceae bacterium]
MGKIDHFTYGWITPALAYAMSFLGALLGLICTARVRTARTPGGRARWLILAAWAIGGTGIWVMHFMAMLGFGVSGQEIRYDVPLTTASAVIAIVVVGIGLFIVGWSTSAEARRGSLGPAAEPGPRRPGLPRILLGGLVTGLGVAAMHYTGMAAMRLDGTIHYDPRLVAASIVIAGVAATVALWFTTMLQRTAYIVAAAMVMGVAVCGMHYTGMLAMSVHLHPAAGTPGGATAPALLIPIVLLVIFVVIGLIYSVLVAPTEEDRAASASFDQLIAGRRSQEQSRAQAPAAVSVRRRGDPAGR